MSPGTTRTRRPGSVQEQRSRRWRKEWKPVASHRIGRSDGSLGGRARARVGVGAGNSFTESTWLLATSSIRRGTGLQISFEVGDRLPELNVTVTEIEILNIDPSIFARQPARASQVNCLFWHSRSLRETRSAYEFPSRAESFWGRDCPA